jgi:hypothetical protein
MERLTIRTGGRSSGGATRNGTGREAPGPVIASRGSTGPHGRMGQTPGKRQENRGAAAEAISSGAPAIAKNTGAKTVSRAKVLRRSGARREADKAGPEEQGKEALEEAGEEAERRRPDVRSGGARGGSPASSPHSRAPCKEETSILQVPALARLPQIAASPTRLTGRPRLEQSRRETSTWGCRPRPRQRIPPPSSTRCRAGSSRRTEEEKSSPIFWKGPS